MSKNKFSLKPSLIIFSMLFACIALANNPDSIKAVEQLTYAKELIVAGKIDSSEILIKNGLSIFKQQDDLYNWISWQKTIGRIFQDEKENSEKAMAIYQSCMKSLWRTPNNPKEYEAKAWLLLNIGYNFKKFKNNVSAKRDYYLWASKILADTLGKEDFETANLVYHELGNAFSNLKDYENAKTYLLKVKEIYKKEHQWEWWVTACSDLGKAYNIIEDYPTAIKTIKGALQVQDSFSLYSRYILLQDLGLFYYHLNDFKTALKHTDSAKYLLSKIDISKTTRAEAQYELYINYGRINKGIKAFDLSEQYYLKAFKILNEYPFSTTIRKRVFMYINFGTLYLEWDKPQLALKEFHRSLNLLLPTTYSSEKFLLPDKNELISERLLIYIFDKLAKIYLEEHKKTPSQKHVNLAIQCYQLTSEVEKLMLQEYFIEGSSFTVLENHRKYKENAIVNLTSLWKESRSPEIADFILKMSERSRAILLLESFQTSKVISENNPEDQIHLTKYKRLRSQITKLEQAIYAHANKEGNENITIDTLKKELFRTKETLGEIKAYFINKSQTIFPKSYSGSIDIQRIQKSLSPDQLLIEYFVAEKHLFIIGISKDNFHIWKKDIPEGFEKTIGNLIQSISPSSDRLFIDHKNLFAEPSHQLYSLLLKEALQWKPETIDRLIIIPDGVLSYIPFELLISEEPKNNFYYNQLQYLLNDCSVSYNSSASLFLLQNSVVLKRAKKSFAGFAPKYKSIDLNKTEQTDNKQLNKLLTSLDRAGEYDLPGAEEEVKYAKDILGGEKFIHQNASESTFKKTANDFQILLLSMHSIIDENNPNFSTLLFTKGSSKDDDDYLHALELSNLELQADLVVLSACNTGYGKLNKGEGVMSFSRAFFAAGIPSTLMTLWKVPDNSSSKIVSSFFRNIKKGLPKDKALQQAKLSYLKNASTEGETMPKFWGGFIAAGNMEPLEIEINTFSYYWEIILISGILVILLISFQLRKRRSVNKSNPKTPPST